jgi:hypothetical protein
MQFALSIQTPQKQTPTLASHHKTEVQNHTDNKMPFIAITTHSLLPKMAPIQGTVYKATHTHHPHPHIIQMSRGEVQAHQNRECVACLMRDKGMLAPNKGPNMFSRIKEEVKKMFRCQQRERITATTHVLESLYGDRDNAAIAMTEQPSVPVVMQRPAPSLTSTQASTLSPPPSTPREVSLPHTPLPSQAPQLPLFADFTASWTDDESIENGVDPWADFSGIHIHVDDSTPTPSEISPVELETAVNLPLPLIRARSLILPPKRIDSVGKCTASGSRFIGGLPGVRPDVLARTHRRSPVVGERGDMSVTRQNVVSHGWGRMPIVRVKWLDVLAITRGRARVV